MEEEKKNGDVSQESKPLGSKKWGDRMRERNPERKYEEDPEEFYNELDSYDEERESEISRLKDSDEKMRSYISKDARLASVLSDIAEDKDPFMSIFENYGDDIIDLKNDPSMAEEISSRQKQKLESDAAKKELEDERAANLEESSTVFKEFMKKNGLNDEQGKEFFDKVAELVDNVFMGKWTPEMCDRLYKGLNYDNDVKAASEIGAAEERNKKIAAKNVRMEGDNIPSAQDATAPTKKSGNVYGRPGFFQRVKR